jgi:hypothetical protein
MVIAGSDVVVDLSQPTDATARVPGAHTAKDPSIHGMGMVGHP